LTFDQAITLLDTIPGVDRRGAEMIVAEIGTDTDNSTLLDVPKIP
jgi:hypothetical protein